ncbi:3-oxoacyl-[acyl-carrier-protein] reductase [Fodinicurvata sp. EGI_FJ10296]|uniref:3-oxoacyl-[acyl-carrier-protein] reductase n=1 Tax=Fodinicurvata sp. EGI_FJ10296 TaxID=3231908 RepID=UPI003451DFF0
MDDLTGKVALVTGASGGIGSAIARLLHSRGASVALAGTREDRLAAVAADLGNERTAPAIGDLSTADGATAVAKAAEEAFGPIDILVNNAGRTRDNLAMRLKDDDFLDILNVNLMSAFRLSRHVMRSMMKRRWGRIVNISSVVAFHGNPGQANYSASKAGLVGMSRSLAAELAVRGITVNCVAPGFIKSDMTDSLTDEQREKILGTIPAGRLGEPDEVAEAVAFLCRSGAGYMTGQTLHVNGGMIMP